MPLDVVRMSTVRPYLYHLTARQNLRPIKRDRELRCARQLLELATMDGHVSKRRTDHLVVEADGVPICIRDQRPLASGAVEFEEGWDLQRFVKHVNEHVFFWPGTASGPIRAGSNHFARYAHEEPVVLRIHARPSILAALRYCRYNSGAPRCSGGKYSPRGSRTYLPAELFSGSPSEVIEVVAKGVFSLPPETELANSPNGPWRALGPA